MFKWNLLVILITSVFIISCSDRNELDVISLSKFTDEKFAIHKEFYCEFNDGEFWTPKKDLSTANIVKATMPPFHIKIDGYKGILTANLGEGKVDIIYPDLGATIEVIETVGSGINVLTISNLTNSYDSLSRKKYYATYTRSIYILGPVLSVFTGMCTAKT